MGNTPFSVEAKMGHARRWASVALSGFVAACLSLAIPGPTWAAQEVLDWHVSGSIDAGGIYSSGERRSSKFNEYRDMDNGFVGELSLKGEKKDQPYYFDLQLKNPGRDDQGYEGVFGRYGLFRVDLGWDRTPHVLSNHAQTIFQESSDRFTLPATLRQSITSTLTASPPIRPNIRSTINDLLRDVDLSINTDVGRAGLRLTPTDEFRFDLEYSNLRRQGHRPVGTVIGSPGGSVTELAIPIENTTHEVKVGAEYARPSWGLQFNYIGSVFGNEFDRYTWDNPLSVGDSSTTSSTGQISAAPDNFAHTLSLTGTSELPLRSRISGTFAYTMLRQDEKFVPNVPNAALTQRSADDAGNTSPDAKANLVMGNLQLTSRPINSVTATARYRYFEYQNDSQFHTFTYGYPEGIGPSASFSTTQERFTKQNAGLDLGWRPVRPVSLKAGYEYEHWNRGDREVTSTDENIGKFSADVTPFDWFQGRVSYSHGDRTVENYQYWGRAAGAIAQLPQLRKFDEADRRRDRVDLLFQFTPWETLSPSINFGIAQDDFHNSSYGLKKNTNYSAGASMSWTPLKWLQLSADYAYENSKYIQQSRYRPVTGGRITPDTPDNDWESKSQDAFHTLGVSAAIDLVPKKFDVTLGYSASFGFTTIHTKNLTDPPATPNTSGATPNNATAHDYDKISNILQTLKVVARYHLTEKLQTRLGYAYERYEETDFARDRLQPYMGDVDDVAAGRQSVFLGAKQPSFEAHILSFFVRYEF
jgi:MtrB/PioB family decaheme-associated outer membrane protein